MNQEKPTIIEEVTEVQDVTEIEDIQTFKEMSPMRLILRRFFRSKLSLVGLGYVGMPIAVAFAKKIQVIGFDINEAKIEMYKKGIFDPGLKEKIISTKGL